MQSRPIREKTPCSKKSGCLTSTNPDFDFEIGNSDFAVKHVFQRWEFHPQSGSQLRNPTPALIDFYMFCVFPRNPKRISSRRGFNEVNRWLENEKKNQLWIFFMKIHLEDRFFIIKIRFCFSFLTTKSVFQNFIRIYRSKAPRTLEPFSQYYTSIRSYFGLF